MINPLEQVVLDVTSAYRAGAQLKPLAYRRAPCDSLVKPADYEAHLERCEACREGWSVFDRPESEERKLDAAQHDQCRGGKFVG